LFYITTVDAKVQLIVSDLHHLYHGTLKFKALKVVKLNNVTQKEFLPL